MKNVRSFCLLLALCLMVGSLPACAADMSSVPESLAPFWAEDSAALHSVLRFVESVTDEQSDSYLPPRDRVAVFDFDGTLFGERFPTYFDVCLFLQRVLHDDGYTAQADVREYAEQLEEALLTGQPEPKSPRSTAQMAAEAFRGLTVEEYRAYIRSFMETPAWGFTNMLYGQGFFLPMTALAEYLYDQGFRVFISSGFGKGHRPGADQRPYGRYRPAGPGDWQYVLPCRHRSGR